LEAYPKPKTWHRGTIERVWHAVAPDRVLVDRMVAALKWQVQDPEWSQDGGRWWPALVACLPIAAPCSNSPAPQGRDEESPLAEWWATRSHEGAQAALEKW